LHTARFAKVEDTCLSDTDRRGIIKKKGKKKKKRAKKE
jgi:hypothetical protein